MHGISDDRLEKWIKLKLSQHRLPALGNTHLCSETSMIPSHISHVLAHTRVGKPLLLLFESDERWTVLGTDSLVSVHSGNLTEVSLDDICEITALGLGTIAKEHYRFLQIQDNSGNARAIWCPPGPEFFAIWNILLGIKRMQQ